MTKPIPLAFDVTEALPAEATEGARAVIAGWLFLPEKIDERPITMTLVAGGSYDKRYHHVQIEGHPGYSAAEHLAAQGLIVLLNDHLGVGESSRLPTQAKATRHIVALANHAAVEQFHARLRAGDLHPGLPPRARVVRIGGGHSMGGMQTIVQQAAHRTYDGVAIMGYTAEGVHMTMGGRKFRAADIIPAGELPDYTLGDRAPNHESFHWEDVPAAVIAADDALNVEVPASIGIDSIRTRIVTEEAGQIEAPVYVCLGERDVSPDPHAEPSYYRSSRDVTLHILPRSGHCQTFASTRREMWDRLDHWSRWVARVTTEGAR
jgi:alpha-beta hydrolase superfamily lysophospholipase